MKTGALACVLSLAGCAEIPTGTNLSYNSANTQQPNYQSQNITPNAYGLGVNSDQFGRPQTFRTQDGQQLPPIFQDGVQQNAYGPGVGMDQFGRPVYSSPP